MNRILRTLLTVAVLGATGLWTATSEATWPRYRVTAGYSLPTAPYQTPSWVPVYPQSPYGRTAPVAPVTIAPPNVSVPGYGGVAPANMQPSLLSPPNVSVPNSSFYPPAYNQPMYNQPGFGQPAYNQPAYNPASVNSYYAPQQSQPYQQPYQQPLPMQSYPGYQAPGGFYQPTRPSSFYSPVPSYYPQPSLFGRY
jgi:hypothetical protein